MGRRELGEGEEEEEMNEVKLPPSKLRYSVSFPSGSSAISNWAWWDGYRSCAKCALRHNPSAVRIVVYNRGDKYSEFSPPLETLIEKREGGWVEVEDYHCSLALFYEDFPKEILTPATYLEEEMNDDNLNVDQQIERMFANQANKNAAGTLTVGEAMIGRYYRLLEGEYANKAF
jgi:hypothetical protein